MTCPCWSLMSWADLWNCSRSATLLLLIIIIIIRHSWLSLLCAVLQLPHLSAGPGSRGCRGDWTKDDHCQALRCDTNRTQTIHLPTSVLSQPLSLPPHFPPSSFLQHSPCVAKPAGNHASHTGHQGSLQEEAYSTEVSSLVPV